MKAIKQSINGFDTLLVSGNSHALIPAIVLINFSFWKNLIKHILSTTSDDSGTQNLGFGFWKCHAEMGLRQGELLRIFFNFSKILAYLTIFQSGAHRRCRKTLKNNQICHKFGKK